MDDDSDLSLNMKEFKKGIHDYGLIMDDDVVSSLFDQLDKDHSGSLSFDEFLTALRVSDKELFPPLRLSSSSNTAYLGVFLNKK